MNSLETQLRSWQPRRPSPRLKRRIFSAAARKFEVTLAVRWLVPATACLLLARATFNLQSDEGSGSSHLAIAAAITNNQDTEFWLRDTSHSVRNNLSPVTFEWTNRSNSTSSIGSFLPGRVN